MMTLIFTVHRGKTVDACTSGTVRRHMSTLLHGKYGVGIGGTNSSTICARLTGAERFYKKKNKNKIFADFNR
jgi:hypothetical protein